MKNPYELPSKLPIPIDDGAADHLIGMSISDSILHGSDGNDWSILQLIKRKKVVIYFYPATGIPGKDPIPGWDNIPGAPGCTVQSLGFKNHYSDFKAVNVDIIGISSQHTREQQELTGRIGLPFLLLSDPNFTLQDQLRLPIFEVNGKSFYKRCALLLIDGVISRVFYPVFPPDKNAEVVLASLC